MYTVTLKVPVAAFASQMAMMREWLNDRRCEPSRFTYDPSGDNVFALRLDFSRGEDAEAFGKRFDAERAGNP